MRAHETTLFFTVAFCGIFFSACRGKNEPQEQPVPQPDAPVYENIVEVTADIVVSGNEYARGPKRVHLGTDNTADHSKVTDILWTAGDEVACWNAEEGRWAPYVLTDGANTTSARFQGKAVHYADNEAGVGHAALNISHAIFPLSATVRQLKTVAGGDSLLVAPDNYVHSIYFTMPSTQVYQSAIGGNPTFGTQYNVMTGTRSPENFNHIRFRSTGGVLMLRIKGSDYLNSLYRLKLTSNRTEHLWGTFTAAIGEGGQATVAEATDINGASLPAGFEGSNSLILDCSAAFGGTDKLPKDKFTNFYFVVPYGVFGGGFIVTMDTDGDGDYDDGTITTTKDNTIIQSDIKVMPALELTENITLTWDLDDMYSQGTVTEF